MIVSLFCLLLRTDTDLDDRLATLAKASEMLHSIAKMAEADSELTAEDDFKSDSEMENEVSVQVYLKDRKDQCLF
jgi:hypothetical protein